MDDQTPVLFIAPIKKEEELSEDHQLPKTLDRAGPFSTVSESTDIPYPVAMFDNKVQTGLDGSTSEQSYTTSTATDDLPDTIDQTCHFEVNKSDKPHTFTSAQIKSENQDDLEYDHHVLPEPIKSITFADTALFVSPEESNEVSPLTSLKQEETTTATTTKNLNLNSESDVKLCVISQHGLAKIPGVGTNAEFSCGFCTKSFKRAGSLKSHISAKHGNEKPYKCSECGESFTNKKEFKKHRWIHGKPFKCNECEKSFSRNIELIVHKRIHSDEEPFKCDVCGKSFTKNSRLNLHKLMHSDEKPFECEVCGKAFYRRDNLETHTLLHTGVRPYQCEICGKSFTLNNHLKDHIRTLHGEKRFKCNVCEQAFARSGDLNRHSRIHSSEKPYKCNVCGKAFPWFSSLQIHNRIHTGDKPYKCTVCDRGFTCSSNLRSHKCSFH